VQWSREEGDAGAVRSMGDVHTAAKTLNWIM